jgi:PAS domain S-box-containing protein
MKRSGMKLLTDRAAPVRIEVLCRPNHTAGKAASYSSSTIGLLEQSLRLATLVCDSPFATLVMPDVDIAWNKGSGQATLGAIAHRHSLERYVFESEGLFEVPNVPDDERFSGAQLVIEGQSVASYAGARVVAPGGRVLGVLSVLNVTARQLSTEQRVALLALASQTAAQYTVCEELAFARGLLESAPTAIYHTDGHGRITYANREYRRVYRLGPEDSVDDWAKSVHPDDRPRMEAAWADFCQYPRPSAWEWRTVGGNDDTRVYAEKIVAATDVAGFVGISTDITEQVSARNSLHRVEALFRSTFEQAPVGIAYADGDTRFERCNRAFCDMLGYDPDELETRSIAELTYAADAADSSTEIQRLWLGEIDFFVQEKRYIRKDQSPVWVRVTATLVRDENGIPKCSVGFIEDIADRKALEVDLLKSRNLLQAVIADIPVAIRACDVDGRIFLHNRAAEALFTNLGVGDSVSQSSWGQTGRAPQTFLPDGTTRVAEQDRPLARALRGETVTNAELLLVPAEGSARTIITSTRPLASDGGGSLGAVAVTLDVTEQRALERELMQAQKLESIGQLAAGIAHEINTPTQFIGDNIRFLQESFRDIVRLVEQLAVLVRGSGNGSIQSAPIAAALNGSAVSYLREELPKAISQSLEGVERIAKIVGAMKEFSHPGVDRTPLDLNRAIASTITVATNEWKYVADVTTDFDATLPLVPVMPGAFNQVILNMIVNAAQAIGDIAAGATSSKGAIAIATRRVDDWVEIDIADTGCGIPAKVLDRIFDPFFTTKMVGKGTGQGLAIAQDVIVKKHGGTISVDSQPGVGTTFTVRLPLGNPKADAAVAA